MYLCWRGHVFDSLIELGLESLTHLGDDVIWSVEGDCVGEDELDVVNELVCITIAMIGEIGIWLARIRRLHPSFDGGQVHWMFDHIDIVGNT